MLEPADTPNRRFRFSLRTLLLFVAVCGCGVGLWVNWSPWILEHVLAAKVTGFGCRSGAFSIDGRLAFTGGENGTCQAWDVSSGRSVFRQPGHGGNTRAKWNKALIGLVVSPCGRYVAAHNFGKGLWVLNAKKGDLVCEMSGLSYSVFKAFFSPDGNRILTLSTNTRAKPCFADVWDASSGEHLVALTGHRTVIVNACFSRSGSLIATGGVYKDARIWDADSGRQLHVLNGHPMMVEDLEFSDDGKRLTTWDGTWVRRDWDVKTGKMLGTPVPDVTASGRHSPDGRRVAVPGFYLDRPNADRDDDKTFILDAATHDTLAIIDFSSDNAILSPDGMRLLLVQMSCDSRIYRRVHPEGLIGVVWVPRGWLTLALTLALLWSLRRDWKSLGVAPSQGEAS